MEGKGKDAWKRAANGNLAVDLAVAHVAPMPTSTCKLQAASIQRRT